MTCEEAAWKIVNELNHTKEYLTWALTGASFIIGLLMLGMIIAMRGERP